MKANELIKKLEVLIENNGDLDVFTIDGYIEYHNIYSAEERFCPDSDDDVVIGFRID